MYRIMLVDDEKNVLRAIQRLLAAEKSYKVEPYTSAEAALRHAQTQTYDLVISDYRMPEMDGITFLKQFKQLQPDAGRLILSAHGDREMLNCAINEVQVLRYIEKPCDQSVLLGIVREAVKQCEIAKGINLLYRLVVDQKKIIEQQESVLRQLQG